MPEQKKDKKPSTKDAMAGLVADLIASEKEIAKKKEKNKSSSKEKTLTPVREQKKMEKPSTTDTDSNLFWSGAEDMKIQASSSEDTDSTLTDNIESIAVTRLNQIANRWAKANSDMLNVVEKEIDIKDDNNLLNSKNYQDVVFIERELPSLKTQLETSENFVNDFIKAIEPLVEKQELTGQTLTEAKKQFSDLQKTTKDIFQDFDRFDFKL